MAFPICSQTAVIDYYAYTLCLLLWISTHVCISTHIYLQVPDEKFLVLINDLLASGEIPDLFQDDELETVINGVRNEVKGVGLQDTKENCWSFFIDRVRRQLKVSVSGHREEAKRSESTKIHAMWSTCMYTHRAVAAGLVSPISTKPCFPLSVACLADAHAKLLGPQVTCSHLQDGCEQWKKTILIFSSQQLPFFQAND